MKEEGISLMYDDVTPVLPEMKELLKLPPSFEEFQKQNEAPPTTEDASVE